eukprot:363618_1
MWSTRCQLLVGGYIRKEEEVNKLWCNIPDPIKHIIYLFYPKPCKVYGVGRNAYSELGNNDTAITKFQQISTFSDHIFDPNDLYTGYHRFTIKTNENRIFSLGNNYNGDCGHDKFQKVPSLMEINMENIQVNNTSSPSSCIVGNGSNTMVFCMNDIMYGTGIASSGQFGPSFSDYRYKKPLKINLKLPADFRTIIQIECSATHVLCLNDKGNMFAWGSNQYNQCGIMSTDSGGINRKVPKITHVKCDAFIKQIKAGSYHNLCISENNKLYVFGKNSYNNCGMPTLATVCTPMLQPYFKDKDVIFMDTKSTHSLVIDSENIAYLFGENGSNQVRKSRTEVDSIQCICVFQKENKSFKNVLIEQGCCGNSHTILLSRDNRLIGFGANTNHQVSARVGYSPVANPHLITKEEIGVKDEHPILRVVAGDYTTLVIVEL